MKTTIVENFGCPRCRLMHAAMEFRELTNPIDECRWFAVCPITKQPTFASLFDEDDVRARWEKWGRPRFLKMRSECASVVEAAGKLTSDYVSEFGLQRTGYSLFPELFDVETESTSV